MTDAPEVACADCPLEDPSPDGPTPPTPSENDFDEADDDETWIATESYRWLVSQLQHSQQIQTFYEDDIGSLLHRPPIS